MIKNDEENEKKLQRLDELMNRNDLTEEEEKEIINILKEINEYEKENWNII